MTIRRRTSRICRIQVYRGLTLTDDDDYICEFDTNVYESVVKHSIRFVKI